MWTGYWLPFALGALSLLSSVLLAIIVEHDDGRLRQAAEDENAG
jgi:hypothetical protein